MPGPPNEPGPIRPHRPDSPPPLARALGTFFPALDWEWVGALGRAEERGKRGDQTRVEGGGHCVLGI